MINNGQKHLFMPWKCSNMDIKGIEWGKNTIIEDEATGAKIQVTKT